MDQLFSHPVSAPSTQRPHCSQPLTPGNSHGARSSINRFMEEPNLINDRQKQALVYLQQHPGITSAEYAKQFACTQKTAHRDLSEMETLHIVLKEGKTRSTVYLLNDPFRTFL
jgi:predicted HTH transcriptional regulator